MSPQVKSGELGSTPAAFDGGLAVPQQLGVGPERGRDQLVVPVHRLQRGIEDTLGQLGRVGLVEDAEEAGVGELGHERRVQAHQVDRAVLGGEAADELLALLRGVVGQGLDVDLVRRALGRALLRQTRLTAVVRVDVPGERRHLRTGTARGDQQREKRYRDHRCLGASHRMWPSRRPPTKDFHPGPSHSGLAGAWRSPAIATPWCGTRVSAATPDAPWALPTARTRADPNRRLSRAGCDQPTCDRSTRSIGSHHPIRMKLDRPPCR